MEGIAAQAHAFASRLAGELQHEAHNRFQGMPSDADSRRAYEEYGRAGFIGLHWSAESGGRGLHPLDTDAVEEAFGYHWLPLSSYLLSVKTIGNALRRFAPPALAERLLPQVARGELRFCQGFSEPEAGSDLASLRTRAVRRDGRFVVSGRKIWTSSAEYADWCYLAVRTDPDLPRHKGVSVLVCPMDTPGIEVITHDTLGGGTLGELVLDEVEIPEENLIGELHGGWRVLMGTLDYERVTSEKVGIARRVLDDLEPYAETPAQRLELLRLRGRTDAAAAIGSRATLLLADGEDASAASSMAKLSIAYLLQAIAHSAADLLGPHVFVEDGPDAVAGGRVAAFHRATVATTIAGGASDIQRRVIARRGLACA
ncbi:acyl-CoA dehydrogenase [Streptomyces spongiicola]|uniref:Acyl-CoA dehydrogenase n=1 Tax=Streptomyces spongiicola TaxID=1690221 RepID=A0A2S1YZU5_9ACTN|nr:acyl-CoA dehydrogenase family protein [Streptomyces spongiicola]AWK09647.1 acyl-CoA dehydrogenase [Streptomyces spongiicola]GBQ04021.1 acyl-CoA dehydrogenase [Streptomyces spongiicola]